MKLTVRNLTPLGFTYSGLFRTQDSTGLFYRVTCPGRVEFIHGSLELFGVFTLTPAQMALFQAGGLSLVPPGCCAPGRRGPKLENATILQVTQPIRRRAQIEQLFADARS